MLFRLSRRLAHGSSLLFKSLKVLVAVLFLSIGLRLWSCFQNSMLRGYETAPTIIQSMLDSIYLRSSLLQRVFSFRFRAGEDAFQSAASGDDSVAELLARESGLTFESHIITAKDGFNLSLHRCYLSTGDALPRERLPVIVMHGLMQDSESLLCGGSSSLASALARAGFDVWLGNNRGNKYSSPGQNGNRVDEWDFSIDELAMLDFPAFVEYVLHHLQCKQVAYVGFSQGSAQAFAGLSVSPDLCEKISLFVALAPAAFPRGFRDTLVQSLFAVNSKSIVSLVFGSEAMLALTAATRRVLSKSFFACAVRHALWYLFASTSALISKDRQIELFQHVYSPSSVKCVQHWMQIMQSRQLCNFESRPYDISLISCPVALVSGEADQLVDAKRVATNVKNCVSFKAIPDYEHLDLIWSDDAFHKVFPHVIQLINSHAPSSGMVIGSIDS